MHHEQIQIKHMVEVKGMDYRVCRKSLELGKAVRSSEHFLQRVIYQDQLRSD